MNSRIWKEKKAGRMRGLSSNKKKVPAFSKKKPMCKEKGGSGGKESRVEAEAHEAVIKKSKKEAEKRRKRVKGLREGLVSSFEKRSDREVGGGVRGKRARRGGKRGAAREWSINSPEPCKKKEVSAQSRGKKGKSHVKRKQKKKNSKKGDSRKRRKGGLKVIRLFPSGCLRMSGGKEFSKERKMGRKRLKKGKVFLK